jgi:hypothetical protein
MWQVFKKLINQRRPVELVCPGGWIDDKKKAKRILFLHTGPVIE